MKTPTINEIAKFIEESTEWLKENKEGCSMMDMPNGLCIAVGWSAGFDNDDPMVITEDGFGICCGIKLNNSYMKTDFDTDFVSLYEDDEDNSFLNEDWLVSPNEDYITLAKNLLDDYKFVEDCEWDERGCVHLHGD